MTAPTPASDAALAGALRGPLVLDANIVIGWAFGRAIPRTSRQILLRVRREGAIAPALLQDEAGKVIAARARGRHLSAARAAWFRSFFADLPIAYDAEGAASDYAAARVLAEDLRLTTPDAAYLELAIRRGGVLVTRDRPLRAAARRMDVPLM